MNQPNQPIQPSLILDPKNQGRARVRLWVFTVISLHVFILMTLLIVQGCKREEPATAPATDTTPPPFEPTNTPPMETNAPVVAPPTNTFVPPTALENAPPAAASQYTIVKGDTFSSIAAKFSVKVKALEAANPGLDPKKLLPGKSINIPAPVTAAASTAATGVPMVAESGETIYTVKSGDTLTKIATHFGVSSKALMTANNLTTDEANHLKVNQKIKIPVKGATAAPPAAAPTTPAQ